MTKLPSISIITPSFNQAQFIRQTIDSVLGQDYPDLQYLVMDGGSTDGTVEILESYGHQFSWVSERDRGQSHALNKGFQRATGEIIAFINSDDYYEPGAFHKVAAYFSSHPDAFWLTGRCRTVDAHGREIRRLITAYKNFWLRLKSYKVLLVLDYISQPATFWRREVIQKVGFFDENLRFSMDYDYSLRVGQHYRLDLLNEYLASFRIHPSSKSGLIQEHFNTDLAIARRYARHPSVSWLHQAHNSLIVGIYRILMNSQ